MIKLSFHMLPARIIEKSQRGSAVLTLFPKRRILHIDMGVFFNDYNI